MTKCSPIDKAQCPHGAYCEAFAVYTDERECAKLNKIVLSKPMSPADRIRVMDDIELMNRVYELHVLLTEFGHYEIAEQFCDCKAECQDGEDCSEDRVKECILRWLQQLAGEATNDRCATCLRWSERNGVGDRD